MEITDVTVTKLESSLEEPNRISNDRAASARPAAIVEVHTDEGLRGIGEGYGPNPHVVETIVEEKYRETLVGRDPRDVEHLWDEMIQGYTYKDQKGPGVAAASGVDIALWDLVGKYYDAPVYRLLGGNGRPDLGDDDRTRVRAYASDLFLPADHDPEAMAERAAEYVDDGFQAVKTHQTHDLEKMEANLAAIRDAIGEDVALMVDMNCAFDRPEALRGGRICETYDAYWYEEPLDPHDYEGYARLSDKLDVPIATGENEYTKWGFKQLFDRGGVDYPMPDVMRVGGLTEAWKVCTLAAANSTVPTPHNFSTGVGLAATLHLVAATPACQWLEYDTTGYDLYDVFLQSDIDVDDRGRIAVPEEPGLGVELPADVVEKYGIA